MVPLKSTIEGIRLFKICTYIRLFGITTITEWACWLREVILKAREGV